MPKTISSQAAKQYSLIGRPYEGLAAVFVAGIKEEESVQRLVEEAGAGTQFWSHVNICLSSRKSGINMDYADILAGLKYWVSKPGY